MVLGVFGATHRRFETLRPCLQNGKAFRCLGDGTRYQILPLEMDEVGRRDYQWCRIDLSHH